MLVLVVQTRAVPLFFSSLISHMTIIMGLQARVNHYSHTPFIGNQAPISQDLLPHDLVTYDKYCIVGYFCGGEYFRKLVAKLNYPCVVSRIPTHSHEIFFEKILLYHYKSLYNFTYALLCR